MDFGMLVMSIAVGLAAGWLARFLMKGGGYGLAGDLLLGLLGSTGGSLIFSVLGLAPGTGRFALVVVALIGAAIVLLAQRQFLPVRA